MIIIVMLFCVRFIARMFPQMTLSNCLRSKSDCLRLYADIGMEPQRKKKRL